MSLQGGWPPRAGRQAGGNSVRADRPSGVLPLRKKTRLDAGVGVVGGNISAGNDRFFSEVCAPSVQKCPLPFQIIKMDSTSSFHRWPTGKRAEAVWGFVGNLPGVGRSV